MTPANTNPAHDPNPGQAVVVPVSPLDPAARQALAPLGPQRGALSVSPQLQAPNVFGLLKALRRRLVLACCLGVLLGGVVAGVIWYNIPPPGHHAQALLQVAAAPQHVLGGAGQPFTNFEMYQRMQVVLIKSRFVLEAALQDEEVVKLPAVRNKIDPYRWLEREIRADFAPGPEILRISMTGDNPHEVKVIVDAVTKAYLKKVVNKEQNGREILLTKLRSIHDDYDRKYKQRLAEQNDLAKLLATKDEKVLGIKQELMLKQQQWVIQKLIDTQIEIFTLQAQHDTLMGVDREHDLVVAAVRALPSALPPVTAAVAGLYQHPAARKMLLGKLADKAPAKDQDVEGALAKQPRIVELTGEINKLEKEIAARMNAAATVKMGELETQAHKKRLSKARLELAEEREKTLPGANAQLATSQPGAHQSLHDFLLQQIASRQLVEKKLKDQVQKFGKDNDKLHENIMDLGPVKEAIDEVGGLKRNLKAKIDGLEIEQHAPTRVDLLEEATVVPGLEGKTRNLMMAGGAGAGCFALVLLGIAFLEFRRRRVDSADDVVSSLGLPLVGSLPDYGYRHRLSLFRRKAVNEANWQAMLSESVDAARTTMLHASQLHGLKVFMVTSALSGEGKTSLACHLAASLERAGRRTLLLDGDIRLPTAHHLFDVPAGPGLSELLRGEVGLDQAIHKTAVGELAVIPGGRGDAFAIQALAQHGLPAIVSELRQRYDFIIIDSCPVLPVADALLLGQCADAVIFSVLREVSQLPRVFAACQKVSTLGIPILGAVLSGAQDEIYGPNNRYGIVQSA